MKESDNQYKAVLMNPRDQVAVAFTAIPAGAQVSTACRSVSYTLAMKESIEFGHKFAVKEIPKGEDILKYGEIIGIAGRDISPGEHVHIHNLEGKRGRGDQHANGNER